MATLASRFGWSYEALMAMTGAERRLWLVASERVAPLGGNLPPPASSPAAAAASPTAVSDAERRARLWELAQQAAARYQR